PAMVVVAAKGSGARANAADAAAGNAAYAAAGDTGGQFDGKA
ncbi:MAG TPA: nucleotide exchange factor GrpE, partial [Brevundimonas sp.]|nr:nucleotide exchange factor GrpE [Brevundimonas sp.]